MLNEKRFPERNSIYLNIIINPDRSITGRLRTFTDIVMNVKSFIKIYYLTMTGCGPLCLHKVYIIISAFLL